MVQGTIGIEKIKLPYTIEDMGTSEQCEAVFRQYLKSCLNKHAVNASKEKYLRNFYGGIQDISLKQRKYATDDLNNNKVVENHAKAQVDFLVDYLFSEEVKYSKRINDNEVDDIQYLDNFLNDSGFSTNIREVKKDMFMLGIGTSFIVPRTDIIAVDGNYLKEYNKDTESPFICTCVNPELNFVVYSSYADEKPLFCVNITDITTPDNIVRYKITIWTRNFVFEAETNQNYEIDYGSTQFTKKNLVFNMLPIIEHSDNKERMGVIETNRDLYNLINIIKSNSADAIFDSVNGVFVFENVEIDGDMLDEMMASGAITITSTGSVDKKANVYRIEIKYNHSDINVFYEQTVTKCYDIAGMPISSGTSSGKATGQSQLLGGGWTNAEIKMNGRIIGMKKSDYEVLKLILGCCKLVPQTKVNELNASEMKITYKLSIREDILSKTQSISNLYAVHMPPELILKYTNISNDINTDMRKWQTTIDDFDKKQQENEMKKANEQIAQDKKESQKVAQQEKGINQSGTKDIKED